ncbi:uncharacterized protein LOC136085968 [Hydra vulgaris]|uniref:Uncharacterized protein LOC136085968 n=1 Tax=Hydra vulgaris TaxID=6087 RepID=A0ABM4CQI2_HYDVU
MHLSRWKKCSMVMLTLELLEPIHYFSLISAIIISKDLAIDEEMVANLDITITISINNNVSYSDIESGNDNEMCNALLYKFNEKLKEFEKRGPTSTLWIQYLNMVLIAKEFIRAERIGDWQGYLNSIKEILPYFYASGHFPYAKSAHLYQQDMLQLEKLMNQSVYQRFIEGFFTVRRSDKLNCGTSTDMVIEQSMIKSMTGETFNIKLKRADKVLPLLTMSSTIKVHDEKVTVDPVLLFQRMSISKTFEDEIEKFFEHETAPYPLSMFDETGMRKTQKSAIYNCFELMEIEIKNANASYIIDGGYLLHRVVWDREATFSITFNIHSVRT